MSSYFYFIPVLLIIVALIFGWINLLSPPERPKPISEDTPSMPQYDGVQFEPPFALDIVLTELISSNKLTEQEAAQIAQDIHIGTAISQMKTKAEIMAFIVDYIKE